MNIVEKGVLRGLAARWMELAALPIMAERKRQWTALHDLHAERPMVLFETALLENYVQDAELVCQDAWWRDIERRLRWTIRHAEEVGDDIVAPPFLRIYWDIDWPDYGVSLQAEHATDGQGGDIAYIYNHPIKTAADIDLLAPRTWHVARDMTCRHFEEVRDAIGDILPVVLHGTGSLFVGLTQDLFKLIGNDNLLTWTYDEPEALHRIMRYLCDDRLAYFGWLEREGLLGLNHTGWELVGSGSPGLTCGLPGGGYGGTPRLRDVWVWMESQETTMISPAMFSRFFLPYMAEVCRKFGLIYYGCCEPVHDRWDAIIAQIPNIRSVSISPWCDQRLMAQKLGRDFVFSRKPRPWPISGSAPDWDALEKDADDTLAAARDCNLEFIYRDVYRIGDRERLRAWSELMRSRIGC
ncbi:MAG: hypothetical protein M1434_13575 [Chloroflexi bacterium]|nr:hypothetical protein [Chloroflexota bacterium]MCL5275753.1 hypothetical protein [Chloroflexota bacterium]